MRKLFSIYWRHGAGVLQKQGLRALLRLVGRKLNRVTGRYQQGYYDFGYRRWRLQNVARNITPASVPDGPLITIVVPVYNIEARWLESTVESVLGQLYSNWQCVLVNDHSSEDHVQSLVDRLAALDRRILAHHRLENGGIARASQTGLELADGEYVALLDHDDLLDPRALLEVAALLSEVPGADFIYSDEDKVDHKGDFLEPFFKPDFSPELLHSQNYIGHLLVLKRSLVEEVGGFRPGFDGAQDYDLVLRASRAARCIRHIPKVLYHWRQIPGSTALLFDEKNYAAEAGRRALAQHIEKTIPGAVVVDGELPGTYHIDRPITGKPLVSVIIPFRDQPGLLDQCLSAVYDHTNWPALEVLCVNNQSSDPEIDSLRQRWQPGEHGPRFIDYNHPFNFAALCNHAVDQARGEYIVLLNNDVEITSDRWLEHLLGHASQPGIGAVGGRLSYPDGRIQHAGIVVGIGGSAGHPFKTFPDTLPGYFGRLQVASNVSAVTGALLMVKREIWRQVGGMDAGQLGIALNDVDFCLRLLEAGYRNVLESRCRGIHYESLSRGDDIDPRHRARYQEEVASFRERWADRIRHGDPYYNPNLTLDAEDYSLNWRDM